MGETTAIKKAPVPLRTTQQPIFPAVGFDRIDDALADTALVAWEHNLGACNRPFGRQSFGLYVHGQLAAVAVSASTINATCGGYARHDVVELARLCRPDSQKHLTRVALRLWRTIAPGYWGAEQWPVRAVVSYSDRTRVKGDVYRFDGWRKVGDVPGGTAGGNWSRGKKYNPKTVWAFDLVND